MTRCVLWLCVLVILLGSRKRLLTLEQSQDSYGLKIWSYIYICRENERGIGPYLVGTDCMAMFVAFTLASPNVERLCWQTA